MTKFVDQLKNEFKVQDKNFYKIILMGLVVVFTLFVSFFNKYFVYVALALAVVSLFFIKGVKKIYLLIFLYPFYGVMRISYQDAVLMRTLVFVTFGLLLIELVVDVVKNKKKLDYKILTLVSVISVYFLLPFGDYSIFRSLRLCASVGVLYFIWEYRHDLAFKELVFSLTYGLLLSCVLSPLVCCVPRLSDLIIKTPTQLKGFYRYSGLIEDPNYFGVKLILSITLLNVLYRNKEINYFYWFMLVVVSCLGLLTLSKSFFIVFICYLLLAMLESFLKKDWKKALAYCIATIIIVSVCWACLNVFIRMMFNRLTGTGYGGSNETLTNLTTGRSDLWVAYFTACLSSVKNFLFGNGIGAQFLETVSMTAAHNMYIEMLYLIGVVGFLLVFGTMLILFIKTSKKENRKFVNFIPVICIAIILFSLNSFQAYRAYVLVVLLCFAMNYVKDKKPKTS